MEHNARPIKGQHLLWRQYIEHKKILWQRRVLFNNIVISQQQWTLSKSHNVIIYLFIRVFYLWESAGDARWARVNSIQPSIHPIMCLCYSITHWWASFFIRDNPAWFESILEKVARENILKKNTGRIFECFFACLHFDSIFPFTRENSNN